MTASRSDPGPPSRSDPGPPSRSDPGPLSRSESPGPLSRHLVLRAAEARFLGPPDWAPAAIGARRWSAIDDRNGATVGAVHTGFGICELEPGGSLPGHVHSFEQSFFILQGEVVLTTAEGSFLLGPDDYGLVPVGVPHAWRNEGGVTARWADMLAPQPRRHYHDDTMRVDLAHEARAVRPNLKDPRTRSFGHIAAASMSGPSPDEVSMRTARLVYSGITVKMMVDTDLGAQLQTMFMVQYEADGVAGPHDHPFEETYLILAGRDRRDVRRAALPAGAGRHRLGRRRVRALVPERGPRAGALARDAGTAAAGPAFLPVRRGLGLPARDRSARRHRRPGKQGDTAAMSSLVIVGGTSGLGLEIARHYADAGHRVTLTGRDADRAAAAAKDVGGDTTGLALDLAAPKDIGPALAGIESVDGLVLAAIERDVNTVTDYDIDRALRLVTLKLVGYTEVVHALRSRIAPDGAIVLFGGLAKERPYPGSTTVSTVNGGVAGLLNTLVVELAPIRVNAIHPGIVGDSPYWRDRDLSHVIARTPCGQLARMTDIVDAVAFLLGNRAVNGVSLNVDGGWLLG